MQTKGIAIRITEDLYDKIEMQNISRNDLITDALTQYFSSTFDLHKDIQDIPSEVYDEVYNNLYNIEIIPMKNKIKHQEQIIALLQESINTLKKDKGFLQKQCSDLISTFNHLKKQPFWKRKK
jgi:hypothetical protein